MAVYQMLRDAIASGDLASVSQMAKQVGRDVRLDDALSILLWLRDSGPDRYDRAAVRWLGRFALEARRVTVDEPREAVAALDVLPVGPEAGMERLQRLCVAARLF